MSGRRSGVWLLAGLALLVLPALAVVRLEIDHRQKILPAIERARRALPPAYAVITAARRLNRALEGAERAQRGYLLTGNAAYLKAFRDRVGEVPRMLAQLGALTAGEPDQQRRLALLHSLIAARLATLERGVRLRADHEADAARKLVDGHAGFDATGVISGAIDNLIEAEWRPVERREAQAVAAARKSADLIRLASIVAAGASFLVGSLWGAAVWWSGRVRARLSDSEERYRLMIGEVSDYAIFMLDTMGRVADWSAGAERIFGYRAKEIRDRHVSCLYPEADADAKLPDRQLGVAVAEGRVALEGWQRRRDGTRFRADTVVTALHDERGKVRGFSVIARDVTERSRQRPAPEESPAAAPLP